MTKTHVRHGRSPAGIESLGLHGAMSAFRAAMSPADKHRAMERCVSIIRRQSASPSPSPSSSTSTQAQTQALRGHDGPQDDTDSDSCSGSDSESDASVATAPQ